MGRVRMCRRRGTGTRILVLILTAALLVGLLAIYTVISQRQTLPDPESTGQNIPETTNPPITTTPKETTVPETTAAIVTAPAVTATQVVVADGVTGKILYNKGDMHSKVYPASITKLFTAYVALQILDDDQVLTAGDELSLVGPDSSMAWIYKGQKVTTAMAVQGLLLNSGNDAAYILAAAAGQELLGRNVPAQEAVDVFVEEMNNMARNLALDGTHWTNPDGYHDENHYTCLADLVVIGQLAMLEPTIRDCVATVSADVRYVSGETNTWVNTNSILDPESDFYEPTACGLKTGHTSAAGYCLLSTFRRDEGYTIIGVFGTPTYDDRFRDTLLLAEAFIGIEWDEPMDADTSSTSTTENDPAA